MIVTFKNIKSVFGFLVIPYLMGSALIILLVSGCHEPGFLGCDFPLILVILPMVPLLLGLEKIGIHPGELHFKFPGPHAADIAWLALYMFLSVIVLCLLGLALGWVCRLIKRGIGHLARE